MSVIKLNQTHTSMITDLFTTKKKWMGVDVTNEGWKDAKISDFNERLYEIFCSNYLSDLCKNFHAYGYVEDQKVKALISFYESTEEPAWFYTIFRSSGNNNLLRHVLDAVIDHNEKNGRLKFYTLVNKNHSKLLRRFHWSDYNNERYGYFDEFLVPAKAKCFYVNPWELLYKKCLVPEDTVVRCNYLKQEYRQDLPIGGRI